MHYVIYPDTLFLENFLCNLLMLVFLKRRCVANVRLRRILVAAVLTALYNTTLTIMLFRSHWMIRSLLIFPVAGWIVCRCLEVHDSRRTLFLLYRMILWILMSGGILQALEQSTVLSAGKVIITVGCFTLFYGLLEKIIAAYERQNHYMREIVLYWDGKSHHFQGFADSGNQLTDPFSNKAVTIVSPDVWNTLLESSKPLKDYLIPFHTVGTSEGLIRCARIDYMVILEGKSSRIVERPVIAAAEQPFTGLFHYSVLLHHEYC